jgi:hypothetical protein
MTRDEALAYAAGWIDAWNRLDIDAVLSTFDQDVEFTSPRALATIGVATVTGTQALRSYWRTALAKVTSLRFSLQRALWDPENRELAIIYVSTVNGESKWVSENLRFGHHAKVVSADVFHGAARPSYTPVAL